MQHFRPKEPFRCDVFAPYGVGYIDLGGELLVEARLTTADPTALAIGAPMELRIIPFATDSDGTKLLTFAFAPLSHNATN